MIVYLGKELGGGAYLPLGPKGARAGVEVLGPSGFLNFLEVHSGCGRPGASPVLRTARFVCALGECAESAERFYTSSFKLDRFGAAARLLALRDNILLGAPESFSFSNHKHFKPGRLRDLAEVSCLAEQQGLHPGEPDRIKILLRVRSPESGQSGFKAIPDKLILREPWESWPRLWTELFDCLAGEGTEVEEFAMTSQVALSLSKGDVDKHNENKHGEKNTVALRQAQGDGGAQARGDGGAQAQGDGGAQAQGDGGAQAQGEDGDTGKTNLSAIQAAIGNPDLLNSVQLKKDGTITHIRTAGLFECGDVTASLISSLTAELTAYPADSQSRDKPSVLIITPPNDTSLDEALVRMGLPRAGHQGRPDVSPVIQFLFRGLGMLWAPVNPEDMRQLLLVHPSPLPSKLRRNLLSVMSGQPGTGGKWWNTLIKEYLEGLPADEREKYQAHIHDWLLGERTAPGAPVSADRVIACCRNFSDWAQAQFKVRSENQERGSVFKAAADQAALLVQVVQTTAQSAFSRHELLQLCEILSKNISGGDSAPREVNGISSVSSASAVLHPVDTLIWYNATVSTIGLSQPDPFSVSENKALEGPGYRRAGTHNSPEELVAQDEAWQTAVKMAAKRIILISPFNNMGEPQEPHPVWHEMLACFKDAGKAKAALELTWSPRVTLSLCPTVALSLSKGDVDMPGKNPTVALAHPSVRGGLQAVSRTEGDGGGGIIPMVSSPFKDGRRAPDTWNIQNCYRPREKESPTSLMSFIECPLKYIFHRSAGISGDDTPSLSSGPLLAGNISHHVLQTFMPGWEDYRAPADTAKRVDDIFTSYVSTEVTLLNLPGMDQEREVLRQRLITSARRLIKIMEANSFGPVSGGDIEVEFKAETEIGPVRGYCDLILRKRSSPEDFFIVDFKTSRKRYHDLVKNGRAVQLAAYSRITQPQNGIWPPTGYLIVESGELVTCHGADVIKEAFSYPQALKEQDVWDIVKVEADKVRKKLEAGIIDYGDGWKDDPDFIPAGCDYCEYRSFCGIDLKEESPPGGRGGQP